MTAYVNYKLIMFIMVLLVTSKCHPVNHKKGMVLCIDDATINKVVVVIDHMYNKLNTTLGVTIAKCGKFNDDEKKKLSSYGVSFLDICQNAEQYFNFQPLEAASRLHGSFCKPAALVLSPYQETMISDLDVIFFKKPELLFDAPIYKKTGTLFFRYHISYSPDDHQQKAMEKFLKNESSKIQFDEDFAWSEMQYPGHNFFWYHIHNRRLPTMNHFQDSSVLLLDRNRKIKTIEVLKRIIKYFNVGHGDKEMYWMAATIAGEEYAFEPYLAGSYGDCDGALLHYDPSSHFSHTTENVEPFFLYLRDFISDHLSLGNKLRQEITLPKLASPISASAGITIANNICSCQLLGCVTAPDRIQHHILRLQMKYLVNSLNPLHNDMTKDCIPVSTYSVEYKLVSSFMRTIVSSRTCRTTGCLATPIILNNNFENEKYRQSVMSSFCDPITFTKHLTRQIMRQMLDIRATRTDPMLITSTSSIRKQKSQPIFQTDSSIPSKSRSRGMILCAGNHMIDLVLVLLDRTHNTLQSTLSVTLANCGGFIDESKRKLSGFKLNFLDICSNTTVFNMTAVEGRKRFRSWYCKPAALVLSPYEETMITDVDVVFFKKPDLLFDAPAYHDTGSLFFRDKPLFDKENYRQNETESFLLRENPSLQLTAERALREMQYPGHNFFWHHVRNRSLPTLNHFQDSSVLLLDRNRKIKTIEVLKRIIKYFNVGHGDKEMYWMAATIAGEEYAFEPHLAGLYGDCDGTLLHHDPNIITKETNQKLMPDPFYFNAEGIIEKAFILGKNLANKIMDPIPVTPNLTIPDILSNNNCVCRLFGCTNVTITLQHIIIRSQLKYQIVQMYPIQHDIMKDCIRISTNRFEYTVVSNFMKMIIESNECETVGCVAVPIEIDPNYQMMLKEYFCDPITFSSSLSIKLFNRMVDIRRRRTSPLNESELMENTLIRVPLHYNHYIYFDKFIHQIPFKLLPRLSYYNNGTFTRINITNCKVMTHEEFLRYPTGKDVRSHILPYLPNGILISFRGKMTIYLYMNHEIKVIPRKILNTMNSTKNIILPIPNYDYYKRSSDLTMKDYDKLKDLIQKNQMLVK